MLTIALCGNTEFDGGSMPAALLECVHDLQIPEPVLWEAASPFDLLDRMADPLSEPLIDYAICGEGQQGLSGIQVARDIRETGCDARILLLESTPVSAAKAQALGVEDYLVQPASAEAVRKVLMRALRALAARDAESVTMRFRDQVKRVPFSQFVYAQTLNHDQTIHLSNGKTLEVRCSSQELFDRFSHDERFTKVSRSFVVNLDHVRTVRQGGAVVGFADGSSIDIPVRFRKALQDALMKRGIAAR